MRRKGWLLIWILLLSVAWAANYPTFQGHFSRTGQIPKGGDVPLALLATFHAGESIVGACSKYQNLFLFGSNTPAIHAMDAFSGKEKWRISTGDFVYGAPTVEDGLAFVGSLDNHLYVVDVASGQLIKKIDLGGDIHGSPALDEENLYVAVSFPRNAVVVLDKNTLTEKGEVKLSQPVLSSVSLNGNTLVVTSNDQKVLAFNKSLQKLWEKELPSTPGFYTPAISGNRVYVVNADLDSRVTAFDLATGEEQWSTQLSTQSLTKASSLAVAGGQVYLLSGSNPVKLYALDESTGAILWSQNVGSLTDYSFYASPIATESHVFVGTPDGSFKVFDKNGNEVQSFALQDKTVATPCGASGMFGIGDLSGTFHLFRIQDDVTAPFAKIQAPAEGSTVGKTFEVKGTADDEHFKKWTLELKDQNGNLLETKTGFEERMEEAFTILTTPSTGNYTLTLTVEDVLGNTSSETVRFLSDHTPPSLTVDQPEDGLVTNQSSVVVSGNTDGVSVTVNGEAVSLDSNGNFATTVSLSEGENRIEIVAANALGNQVSQTLTVTRDTQAPELTITSPEDHFLTNADTVEVTGSVSGAVSLLVNGKAVSFDSNGSFATNVALSEGENVISVKASDQAGNTKEIKITGSRDSTPPPLEITSPEDGWQTTLSSVKVKGKTEPGATVTVNDQAVSVAADGSFSKEVSLLEGENHLTIEAKDPAGNKTQQVLTVTLRSQAIEITSPEDGLITNSTEIIVSGKTYDVAEVKVNGKSVPLNNGSFSTKLALTEGIHSIIVEGTLADGTKTSASRKVIIDTTPPSGTISAASEFTNKTSVSLTLTAQDENGIKAIYLSEASNFANKQVLTPTEKKIEAEFTLSSGDGEKTIYVRFVDNAGNTKDSKVTLFLDTQPPAWFALEPDLPKPYLTGNREVVLNLNGEDNDGGSGLKEVWLSEDQSFASKIVVPLDDLPATASYTLSSGDGQKELFGRLFDRAGNSLDEKTTITLDSQGVAVIPLDQIPEDIELGDGTKLEVPKGSLKQKEAKAYLVIRGVTVALPDPADPDIQPTDVAKEILVVDKEGRPQEASFAKPLKLTLSFKRADKQKLLEGEWRIFQLNSSSQREPWELVPGKQEVDPKNEQVTASISSPGIFRLMAYKLSQKNFISEVFNYPNPFHGNGETNITYKLKNDASEVRIEVYSMSGQKLTELSFFQGQKGALIGRNVLKFSATKETGMSLPNGVYFYRIVAIDLQGNQSSRVGKMVVLR